jgi:hypothetical protein
MHAIGIDLVKMLAHLVEASFLLFAYHFLVLELLFVTHEASKT